MACEKYLLDNTFPPICLEIINSPHVVYVLQSTHPKYQHRTYVGYTVDLKRRIRQHNGELVGGAKYTKVGRPYRVVCFISGFPTKNAALQFEWRCHHPSGKVRKRGRGALKTRFDKGRGIERRYNIIQYVLNLDHWTQSAPLTSTFSLTINWLISDYPNLRCPHHYAQYYHRNDEYN